MYVPSSLTGVYGRRTAFSAPSGLNLVRRALATLRPETWSSSGSLNRRRLVLWLTVSTSSSCRLRKPCSPPVKAFFASALATPPTAALVISLTFASAFFAAGVPGTRK